MAANNPLECEVCHEDFDEDERCPRILPCTHYLCTRCINQIIGSSTKKCPFCRKTIVGSSTATFMVNRALIDVMKFMSAQSTLSKASLPRDEASVCIERVNYFKKETTATTKSYLESYKNLEDISGNSIKSMEEMKTDIRQHCDDIENEIMVMFKGMVQRNRRRIDDLSDRQNDLSTCIEEVKKKQMFLENLIQRLDGVKTFKDAGSLLDEAERLNITVSEWAETFKARLSKEEEVLQGITKDRKSTDMMVTIVLGMLKFREEKQEFFEEYIGISGIEALLQTLKGRISIANLQAKREPVQRLLKQERVFAVQEKNGRSRSARITLRSGKLYLHHLIDGLPPQNAFFVEHEALLSLVVPSSRLAFLTLGAKGAILGRLLIRLSPDSKGARNFSFLCTGEKGPSYANTKLLEVHERGYDKEYVRGGDYEFNNGNGGKSLISGLKNYFLRNFFIQRWTAGTLWGQAGNDYVQYCIGTRTVFCRRPCSFGVVVGEGLEVLKGAIEQYQDVKDIRVIDCGIVLPY